MRVRLTSLVALFLVAAFASCRDAGVGTALLVRVSFDNSLNITQLRFSGQSVGRSLFSPVVRPEGPPGSPLVAEQRVRILLPDSLGGADAIIGVEGLAQGSVAAAGTGSARVKKGSEVEIAVMLGPPSGPDCGPCSGCCAGIACVSPATFVGCGGNGTLCMTCDPTRADSCSSAGSCRCGGESACAPERGSDRCVQGRCLCGQSSCAPGERCVNGECLCTPASCPNGCCQGRECLAGSADNACGSAGFSCEQCNPGQHCVAGVCSDCPSSCGTGCCSGETCHSRLAASCGVNGAACTACDPVRSDSCSPSGACQCGTGPECGPGRHCVVGSCHCDGASCPNGCCLNDVCQASSFLTCGTGGGLCTTCARPQSDRCSTTGACSCGNGASCEPGQKCQNGTCVCDPNTCAGCCSGNECIRVPSASQCGVAGLPCQACAAGVDCVSGVCSDCPASCVGGCCSGRTCMTPAVSSCGNDGGACFTCSTELSDRCRAGSQCGCGDLSPCAPGQECAAGACVCTGNSCPDGCCDSNLCRPRSTSFCGIGGGSCRPCDSRLSDTCTSDGRCQCGSAPDAGLCNAGQQCVNGQCVCTPVSCAGGCCFNQNCVTPSLASCGADGGLCFACDPVRANVCAGGRCLCGSQPLCPAGRRCDGGACQ